MLAGPFQGKDTIITDLDAETWACGVGKPRLSPEGMAELEDSVCPTAGSCALLGTANTMQCLAEAVGLALPGSATAPAVSAQRLWFAKQAGRRIVELVRDDLRPAHIMTRPALENMIRVLHAIGGSTNGAIHILALAQELDLTDGITLETVEKLSTEVHCIVNVKPSGIYTMADFDEAGGVPAVMKVLEGRLHLRCRPTNWTLGGARGHRRHLALREGSLPCMRVWRNPQSGERGCRSALLNDNQIQSTGEIG